MDLAVSPWAKVADSPSDLPADRRVHAPAPPFLGAPNVGVWRPHARQRFRRNTADRHHDAVGTHATFAVPLAPPLALDSQEYAADLNEVKVMGTSLARCALRINRNSRYFGH